MFSIVWLKSYSHKRESSYLCVMGGVASLKADLGGRGGIPVKNTDMHKTGCETNSQFDRNLICSPRQKYTKYTI